MSIPLDQWIADQMAEEKKARKPEPERVRDEVYGMRIEDIIEGAEPTKPKPSAKKKPEVSPAQPEWRSIEDQMTDPMPGKQVKRRLGKRS
ncbi:MAG TPA: hypothetical protein VKA18_01000 [Alphaproteobacteria bacterium]|nr:hypothetical protein [Alphaproteobacteria bacterium]